MTRVKYRGVAVADTARERPVLTVQLLDKQPRLTVTSLEDKRRIAGRTGRGDHAVSVC